MVFYSIGKMLGARQAKKKENVGKIVHLVGTVFVN
jgi:hypothetical protein